MQVVRAFTSYIVTTKISLLLTEDDRRFHRVQIQYRFPFLTLFHPDVRNKVMSDFGCAEDLSEELIEDLRLKGLLSFVVIEHSSNSAITLLVYENEKYRPIVREWGSAVGIHILPPLDRRPFTDDLGNHSIR